MLSHWKINNTHNCHPYGGAGYAEENIAVISTHEVGPSLAVYELGHSLFELGDEYTYGPATADTRPNCGVAGCPKWSDLNDYIKGNVYVGRDLSVPNNCGRYYAGSKDLCSQRSCENGQYFVGSNSFMRNMSMDVGLDDLRFTCCTYQALTKSMPSYCDQFEPVGNGLLDYCKNDYQGYGWASEYIRRKLGSKNVATSGNSGTRHTTVEEPVVLSLELESKKFQITSDNTNTTSTIFRNHQVHGEFADIGEAKAAGFNAVHSVRVLFESGETGQLFFGDVARIVVPPSDPCDEAIEPEQNENVSHHTRKELQIVVEKSKGSVVHVEIERVHFY